MTDVNGSSISYRYDLAGRVLQTLEKAISTSTERITEYGYDVLGNLTSVKDTRGRITTMTYDAVNRLSEKTLPNGVKTVYSYDELDRVSKIETKNGSGVVLSSMTYERTGVGEPSKITREDGSYVTYSYDSALRLTKESYFNPAGALQNEITYGYDASGKRISKNNQVYAYNNAYQLQTVTGSNGSESYGYDADGRVSAINRDGQTLNLSHDSYDRLTQANDVTYLYDGSGNRIKAVSGTSERKFLQASNGGLAITELLTDADGNVISDYVYGNGSTPISKIDASGNSVYYLTDAMGSVIGEVDGDGNLITRIQYDGFGNVWSQSGSAISSSGGDFRFQGQWMESESGLYYFRARDYDAKTGLFLSRDAVAPSDQQPESMNPYQFAYQNPLIYSDPSGMFTILELNASQSIETTLAGIRTYAGQEAKNYLLKKLGDAFSNVISSALNAFLPGSTLLKDVMNGTTEFENGLKGVICPYFDGLPLKDNLFLEVRIDNGIPKNNGFNCSNYNQVSTNPKVVNKLKSLPGSYPDFLFRNSLPLSYKTKDSGAYIIGDVKFFIGAARKDILSNDNQWQNMAKYASSYQILPFVSYLALFETNVLNPSAQGSGGLSKTDKLKLAEEALKKNVILILANIIDK
jgi:RHS repeat-associated protein